VCSSDLVGFFGRWLGLFYAIEFAIALVWVKVRMQSWAAGNMDLLLLASGVLVFLAGPGRAAVDAVWLERPSRRERAVEARRAA